MGGTGSSCSSACPQYMCVFFSRQPCQGQGRLSSSSWRLGGGRVEGDGSEPEPPPPPLFPPRMGETPEAGSLRNLYIGGGRSLFISRLLPQKIGKNGWENGLPPSFSRSAPAAVRRLFGGGAQEHAPFQTVFQASPPGCGAPTVFFRRRPCSRVGFHRARRDLAGTSAAVPCTTVGPRS